MKQEDRIRIFLPWIEMIKAENEQSVSFVLFALSKIPEYFFVVPASSSGKYHPKLAKGNGGLVNHTKLVLNIVSKLWEVSEPNIPHNDIDPLSKCKLLIAALFHDCCKSGYPEKNPHTVSLHPNVAADFIDLCWSSYYHVNYKADGSNDENLQLIYNIVKDVKSLIRSHMGKWNCGGLLPKPETRLEIILHQADYLAAQYDNLLDNINIK